MVMVNLPTAGVDFHVPFGGRKGSSYGPREQGRYAAEFFTTVKTAYQAAGWSFACGPSWWPKTKSSPKCRNMFPPRLFVHLGLEREPILDFQSLPRRRPRSISSTRRFVVAASSQSVF